MADRQTRCPRGRPTLLRDPARAAILTAVGRGAALSDAARAAGVGVSTVRSWMSAGRTDERARTPSPVLAFLAAAEKARAEFVVPSLAQIRRAGRKDWRAAAWLLERRHPEHFGRGRGDVRRLLAEAAPLNRLVADLNLQQPAATAAAGRSATLPEALP